MKRYRQTFEEIISKLSAIQAEWKDDLAKSVMESDGRERDRRKVLPVPSKEDARILIEVKAYGATGSKQTDILGDMERIIGKKRHDTTLLFVTDGITWKARTRDLRKLIDLQNEGKITRIYTSLMFPELRDDLLLLRSEHGLERTPHSGPGT